MTDKESQRKRLSYCRYYTEGGKNYSTNGSKQSWYWDMERVFVESGGNFTGELDYYIKQGGKTFAEIPNALLDVMVTSWFKTAYDWKASLPKFYADMQTYLEKPKIR